MAEHPLLVAVTALPGSQGGSATAAALGVAVARSGAKEPLGVVVFDAEAEGRRRPTLVSSAPARELESRLAGAVPAVARGTVCSVTATGSHLADTLDLCRAADASAVVIHARPRLWRELIDTGEPDAAVLRADSRTAPSLTALAARDLIAQGLPTGVVTRTPGVVATRRALAGIEPGGDLGARSARMARRFLGAQGGQVTPLTLFLTLATVLAGVLMAVIGAAATGASGFQRAADLAAISAARSMRDDHHRLFLPATLPNGVLNPAHLSDAEYRRRAIAAAAEAVVRNGAEQSQAAVTFPAATFAPTQVRVVLRGSPTVGGKPEADRVKVKSVAEAYPAATNATSGIAGGGGYSGPLAMRQGQGMRPDVAKAFDAMSAAAMRDGHALLVNSAFRSDAEQAALFAANPDPRMVARPGTSLHRCGTELDLGPSAAYGWLAANAQRFGFVQRYSWEAWHYGFTQGPAPCSAAGDAVGAAPTRGGDGPQAAVGLPSFVPARFRDVISGAATRWNVPGNVLAAQLLAESNFNPLAISPAGAGGIAQFMPSTAAAYGLGDPFDPDDAIDAQAHLMSDLIAQFGDVSLALAAYNAGPAPVQACSCVPPYPETQAYVARILGLMGGVGASAPPGLEVRLVGG